MAKVYQCLCGQCLFTGLIEGYRCEKWIALERWKDMSTFELNTRELAASAHQQEAIRILFPEIFLHTVHGLTGKQVLAPMRCPAPDFTTNVVEWYINNFDTFRPKYQEGDELETQCRFYVTWASRASGTPDNANRVNLPILLIELLDVLGLPPMGSTIQPEAIHLQVNLIWLQTMDICEICGSRTEGEYIPFYNCRFCGARPSKHHGKCCPKKCEDNRVHGDLRDEYGLQLLLQSVMDFTRYDQLERKYAREFLTSLSHGPIPFRRPPSYQGTGEGYDIV